MNTTQTKIAYQVVCNKTGVVLKEFAEGKRANASRYADKKDLAYGAICCHVKLV